MRRAPAVVPALAAVLLLSGCTSFVIGRAESGRSGSTTPGDVTVVGAADDPVDDRARDALADLETYWADVFPDVYGRQFQPLQGGYFSVDPDDVDPRDYPDGVGCGQQPVAVESNAFYCQAPNAPHSDSISYDRSFLAELADGYGQFIPALVMAHEFGHAIQARVGAPSASIAIETQADCLAGTWTRWVAEGKAEHSRLEAPELDELLRGYLLLRDPVGTGTAAESAHGSYFDRVSAFQEGFDGGAAACRDDFGPGRTFTQGEFTTDTDFRRQGNAPYQEVRTVIEESLPEFWQRAFDEVFGKPFRPPTLDAFRGTAPDCAEEDRDLVYCPDGDVVGYDETDLALPALELGDFAVLTAVAIPYALAARDQLGLPVEGDDALRSAVCLTGWYSAQVYNGTLESVEISPGDLDESVQFLLTYGLEPQVLGEADLTGFQLVDLFRGGFVEGVGPCDVGA
ncbi:MAG TPA: neutral zinc metallopeptidase [Blastococcus sp.]|nr:neutral zinc metallopeptidase [Blastococcus sp.]